jgi:hypothetical protein
VRLRLHGPVEALAEATGRLVEALDVVSASDPDLDGGARVLVRAYLEVRFLPAPPAAPTRPTSPAPPAPRPVRPTHQRRRRLEGHNHLAGDFHQGQVSG